MSENELDKLYGDLRRSQKASTLEIARRKTQLESEIQRWRAFLAAAEATLNVENLEQMRSPQEKRPEVLKQRAIEKMEGLIPPDEIIAIMHELCVHRDELKRVTQRMKEIDA